MAIGSHPKEGCWYFAMEFKVMKRTLAVLSALLAMPYVVYGQDSINPFGCEGRAQEAGRKLSLKEIPAQADALAQRTEAVDRCTAAELYKRLGDPKASELYEDAIKTSPNEPAYELFYGEYLRLYRGAGQRPLFPRAEEHLLKARGKLLKLLQQAPRTGWPPCSPTQPIWHQCTTDRVQRSLTALYERDGIHVVERKATSADTAVQRPWLFFSPGVRLARSTDDFDQSSDVRDLTSAALFSQNCLPAVSGARRNCGLLSEAQLAEMARVVTPMEADATLRIRYGAAPVVDIFGSARKTENGAINSSQGFYNPNAFSDLKLTDFGFRVEKPFTLTGNTDADLQFSYDHVTREGLIEFQPHDRERIGQFQVYGSLSHYLGPDRINLSYTYVRQNINPTPDLTERSRELMGATVDYQLFRPLPLPGRNANTGLGRHFQTRGIDLIAGFLDDRDRYTGPYPNVITRQDYFVGVNARGFGPVDVTFQPTRYLSRVSNDPTQSNSQYRMAGNVLYRILDEERTPGIPGGRFLGLPVAFVQVVVPFHWDVPRNGLPSFQSKAVGAELWAKFFTDRQIGVTVLGVVGYSRDWFPVLNKDFNLGRIGFSIGF